MVQRCRWAFGQGQDFIANHQVAGIDFATFHSWVDNWFDDDINFQTAWIQQHAADAAYLGKPVRLLWLPHNTYLTLPTPPSMYHSTASAAHAWDLREAVCTPVSCITIVHKIPSGLRALQSIQSWQVLLEEFGKWIKGGTSATLAQRDQFYQAIYQQVYSVRCPLIWSEGRAYHKQVATNTWYLPVLMRSQTWWQDQQLASMHAQLRPQPAARMGRSRRTWLCRFAQSAQGGGAIKGAAFWEWFSDGQTAPVVEGGGSGLYGIKSADSTFGYIQQNAAAMQQCVRQPPCMQA